MNNLNINKRILINITSSLVVVLLLIFIYISFKEKKIDNSQKKIDEIRIEKEVQISKKQKQIDSILLDLEINRHKIIFLTRKIDVVNNDNKNLEKELARKKSEIIKMSNDEIVKYWQDEFKK